MSHAAPAVGILLGAAGVAALLACGRGREVAERPEILWGEQECGHCRMIVAEPRFAAALAEPGRLIPFDDLGCLMADLRARPEAPAKVWVHAYDGDAWLPAERARYVRRAGLATPMGSGWVAFAAEEAARAFAVEGGESVRDWTEARRESAAR